MRSTRPTRASGSNSSTRASRRFPISTPISPAAAGRRRPEGIRSRRGGIKPLLSAIRFFPYIFASFPSFRRLPSGKMRINLFLRPTFSYLCGNMEAVMPKLKNTPPPKNYDKLLITRVLRPHHTLSSPTAGRDFSHPYRPIFFNLSNNILKNKHHGKKL